MTMTANRPISSVRWASALDDGDTAVGEEIAAVDSLKVQWAREPDDGDTAVPALELRGVSKDYGSARGAVVHALADVSLVIHRGESVGIVGPSGSGKSTLLNIMGTLDRPTVGSVHVSGWEVSRLKDDAVAAIRARSIGFVFQQFFLLDNRTAADNVADGLLYSGIGRAQRRRRAEQALARVGLAHRADHRPNELSGGECQRVAIARALVHDPDILLADEPTGNLDSRSGQGILALFESLHQAGATIAVITHDHSVAARFARIVTVKDGRIESDTAAPKAGYARESGLREGDLRESGLREGDLREGGLREGDLGNSDARKGDLRKGDPT